MARLQPSLIERRTSTLPEDASFDSSSQLDRAEGRAESESRQSQDEDSTSEDSVLQDEDEEAQQQFISSVPFATLKDADDRLSRKRKRVQDTSEDQEGKLALLRQRLHSIKTKNAEKVRDSDRRTSSGSKRDHRQPAPNDREPSEDESDDRSSQDSSDENTTQHRSKHAPAMVSSKYQVTRKRQVVDVPKLITRDPRFDALRQNQSTTTGHEEKAYSFLRDYQKAEMQELKIAMKAAKTDADKQTLRRKLNSMQNQAKAREAKEREKDIVRKHRQQEGEQIRQGKTPYFLKKGEIKQRALVDKFQSMKGKDREKLLERRRLKESQREKRRMPSNRESRE